MRQVTQPKSKTWCVLLVEDDITVSAMVDELLQRRHLKTVVCRNVQETTEIFRSGLDIGAAVVDLGLPDGNGLDVIRRTRQAIPDLPFFILTANDTVESAVMAMKAGALDYFTKPFDPEKLITAVSSAMALFCHGQEHQSQVIENDKLNRRWKSPKMRQAVEIAKRASQTRSPVLITGPSSTGKRELALKIHQLSAYQDKPFLTFNAAAIKPEELELQLFGQLDLADSEAEPTGMKGRLHAGIASTIFISNIECLGIEAQGRLLEWLQTGNRLSPAEPSTACRLITASTASLPAMILEGAFRESLWYALAVHHIEVPSLAARQEDLPLLCEDIITKLCVVQKRTRPSFTRKALETLLDHTWPGNLAELEFALEQGIANTTDRLINKDNLPNLNAADTHAQVAPALGITSIEELNKASLMAALDACGGNRRRTAKRLRVSLRTVYNMIKRYGLDEKKQA